MLSETAKSELMKCYAILGKNTAPDFSDPVCRIWERMAPVDRLFVCKAQKFSHSTINKSWSDLTEDTKSALRSFFARWKDWLEKVAA